MNRKVIYTCLTGGYDRLEQPAAIEPSSLAVSIIPHILFF